MITKKVTEKNYALKDYLDYVDAGDICTNADVQRLAGNFDRREMNELIYTVLTSDHIPEIILAKCVDGQLYIVDGLQRTTILRMFRDKKLNYKISAAIDNSIVEYMKKSRNEKGNVIKNERDQIKFEESEYDIKNKTFELIPEELKKIFNSYQIRVVIHEDCTMRRISDLIQRYNRHKPMSASQSAFTYMDTYAVSARAISNKKFFIECTGYKEKEKVNGTIERVMADSVMCIYHLDDWKTSPTSICKYLNEKSKDEEFFEFGEIIDRLGNIYNQKFDRIFTSKNSFIWFNLFKKFTDCGLSDNLFAEFIDAFHEGISDTVVDSIKYKDMKDVTYNKLDKETGTKDKILVEAKLSILTILMNNYLHIHIEKKELEDVPVIEFIRENVGQDINQSDIDMYIEDFDRYSIEVDNNSKLMDSKNRPSFLALIAYSYIEDIHLDKWFIDYFNRSKNYIIDQKENFIKMCDDLKKYNEKLTIKYKQGGKLSCVM